jgi:hypothetical protein
VRQTLKDDCGRLRVDGSAADDQYGNNPRHNGEDWQ